MVRFQRFSTLTYQETKIRIHGMVRFQRFFYYEHIRKHLGILRCFALLSSLPEHASMKAGKVTHAIVAIVFHIIVICWKWTFIGTRQNS